MIPGKKEQLPCGIINFTLWRNVLKGAHVLNYFGLAREEETGWEIALQEGNTVL